MPAGGRKTRKASQWAKAAGEYYRAHKKDDDINSFSDVLKSPKFKGYYNKKYKKGNKRYRGGNDEVDEVDENENQSGGNNEQEVDENENQSGGNNEQEVDENENQSGGNNEQEVDENENSENQTGGKKKRAKKSAKKSKKSKSAKKSKKRYFGLF